MIIPNGCLKASGTGDLVLVTDDVLEVMDFKFGQGIPVSAVDNPQMRLYALGALNQFGCLYEINTASYDHRATSVR